MSYKILIASLSLGIISLVAIAGFLLVINHGIIEIEKNECRKWQKEALLYPNYYLTDWQIAQCEAVAPETLTH